MALIEVLELLYDREINTSVSCFWEGGWDLAIGDDMNGWKARTTVEDLEEAPRWFLINAAVLYPKLSLALKKRL